MNIMKKLIVVVLAMLVACSTMGAVAFATENPDRAEEEKTVVTQFFYTVYDKDGNVKETGVTPDENSRYTWSGITLNNGDRADFLKQQKYGFYIEAPRWCDFQYDLNRACSMRSRMIRMGYSSPYVQRESSQKQFGIGLTVTDTGTYYWSVANISSDPVTITQTRFVF